MKDNKTNGSFIFEWKAPYPILECDISFFKMMSMTHAQYKEKTHYLKDFLSDSDFDAFIKALEFQLQRSNYTKNELTLTKYNQKQIQVILEGQIFQLKDGREVLQCVCTDITDYSADLSANGRQSDLEAFSQSVRCGLSKHLCDNALTLLWANDYFYTLFGYEKAEYIEQFGDSIIPMIYDEDLPLVINSLTNLMEDHEIDISFRIKHKHHAYHWVNLIAASVESEEEFPVANFVINDVTKLKLAEMKAELEAKKYEIISDISEEIPYEYEILTDTITYAKKYETIFGRKSIYRHPARQFAKQQYVSEDTISNFSSIFETARNGSLAYSVEYKLLNKEGEYEWHSSTFSLIQDKDGTPLRAVGILRNIHAQKQEQEFLLEKAQKDSMTGLLNKATTEAYAQKHLNAIESGTKDVLLLVDIDDFKSINDTYGHLIGDKVILAIANTLTTHTQNDGFVGRIGGDEFLVYLPGILDTTLACEKAEKYASELLQQFPGGNGKPRVTLSIGIAATDVSIPYSDLLEHADAAVYKTKSNGKNGYVFYDDSLEREAYHNEREEHLSKYHPVIIGNATNILCEDLDTRHCIQKAIQYIGNALHIDRIVIWKYMEDRNFLDKFMEWTCDTYSQNSAATENFSSVQWEEIDALSITETCHITNNQLLTLSHMGNGTFANVKELTQYKFEYNQKAIGYICYFNYSNDNNWSTQSIETQTVFSKILAASIQKEYIEQQLQQV